MNGTKETYEKLIITILSLFLGLWMKNKHIKNDFIIKIIEEDMIRFFFW